MDQTWGAGQRSCPKRRNCSAKASWNGWPAKSASRAAKSAYDLLPLNIGPADMIKSAWMTCPLSAPDSASVALEEISWHMCHEARIYPENTARQIVALEVLTVHATVRAVPHPQGAPPSHILGAGEQRDPRQSDPAAYTRQCNISLSSKLCYTRGTSQTTCTRYHRYLLRLSDMTNTLTAQTILIDPVSLAMTI